MQAKPIRVAVLTFLILFVFVPPALSNVFDSTNFTNIDIISGMSAAMFEPLNFELIHTGFPAIGVKCQNWEISNSQWMNLYGSNGDGTFTTLEQNVEMPEVTPYSFYRNISGDIDGDGFTDLYTRTDLLSEEDYIRLSIPGGGLSDPYSFMPQDPATVYGICDMDGDLLPDLYGKSSVPVILYLNESGEYDIVQVSPDGSCDYPTACDIDLDGAPDMLLTGPTDEIHVFHNDGDRVFSEIGSYTPPSNFIWGLLLCDLNGDGYQDIVVPSSTNPGPMNFRFHTYINDGNANFSYGESFLELTTWPGWFGVEDIDMDGIADLAVAHGIGIHIYKGDGAGSFQLEPTLISLPDVEDPGAFVFEDYDCDGDPDMCCVIRIDNTCYLRVYWNTTYSQNIESGGDLVGDLSLSVSSNPFSTGVTINATGNVFPEEIYIFDATGRIYAQITAVAEGSYFWNGMTDEGEEASAGIYFASAQVPDGAASTTLVKLE